MLPGMFLLPSDQFNITGRLLASHYEIHALNVLVTFAPLVHQVASITSSNPPLVTVMDEQRHGMSTGDTVIFNKVVGMVELEGKEFEIRDKGPYSFELVGCDGTHFSPFVRGYVNQVKKHSVLSFKCLEESIQSPEPFVETDFAKIGRPKVLHAAFCGLNTFYAQHGRLPRPCNLEDASKVLTYSKANPHGMAIDGDGEVIVLALGRTAAGSLTQICAAVGGIVGQEALKACSGKFTPLQQWLYLDAVEALPDNPLSEAEVAPLGCRYDGQIAVFGRTLQEKLGKQNLFLVGAGAIGCEMLKTWAMMGIACGGGTCHVTDMDYIERSNLSRQFLFRESDISHSKSSTAANAVVGMNPSFNVKAYELKCDNATENVFGDDFYASLSGVCTALDNVEARLYVDQRCVFYRKPMFESGTLGAKGNTQIVVPYLTENYGASRDPPEKSIPVCTLRNFPNKIEHTLQWARDWFEGALKQKPDDVNQYLSSADFPQRLATQANTKLDTLKSIEESLGLSRPTTYEHCVAWARLQFQDLFYNAVAQLLHNFPPGTITSAGAPFWVGAKRPPTPIVFEPSDPVHMDFISSAANLRATNYGINPPPDHEVNLEAIATSVVVPPFKPVEGLKIATTEEEAKESQENGARTAPSSMFDVDEQCDAILASLPQPKTMAGFRLVPVEFDKDLDSHMILIAAASNLRARCYQIPEADVHTSRFIAGKIIPAIATTTALVSGLVSLELLKVLQWKPLEAYKSWFLNISVPFFSCSGPIPPSCTTATIKGSEWKWSAWDSIDVNEGNITLRRLFELLEERYNLEVTMLSHGVSMLYSFFANKKKIQERMEMKLTELVETVSKNPVGATQKYLCFEVCANDVETEEEVELPYLRIQFR